MNDQKLKSSFSKPYSLTLAENTGYFLNKHTFGMENYEPRNQGLNLVPAKAFLQQKAKRETFVVSVPNLTKIVPGPGKYSKTVVWSD